MGPHSVLLERSQASTTWACPGHRTVYDCLAITPSYRMAGRPVEPFATREVTAS